MSVLGGGKKGTAATEKVEDGLSLGHVIFKLLLYKWRLNFHE